ncbi:uncharacterized protein LOC110744993 [Prunus avium]|uniref:Uncharacterized protein LOC110744993 n=1 Tax=Prunus avium TaxID=42229 RepID=A0A6P5R744_PRUAV|nr:uncharacterized protein LOC110744993 [Prunus avium]XP_021800732.1 uncharacterized protein LOC110744993 [Prunus avium]XP_021800733.1 uncharacterized protein LOC110744993 [Prunus avium]XP_021800735.1 uncharacterized protein LOC110744993 [Prunus avium]
MAPKRTRGMSMEELLPPSPLRRKKGKHQAQTSQQRSSSSSQPQVTSSRQPTSSVQSEQAYVVRRQRAQLETQLSQQNVVASEDDHLTGQPDESGQMESEDIIKGRGAARSIPQWGTGNILHVTFDPEWKPIKANASLFSSQLGIIARNGKKIPLTYPTWNDMPDDILDNIWKDITDNTDAPEAYRFHCLKVVGNRWRDQKCRLKQKWYDRYDTDEQRLAITPPRVVTEQWKTLVKYWGLPKVKECSEMNKVNRAQGGAPHRTGRTSFAQLRNVMKEKGEKTDRLSMFIKTRKKKKKNDEDEVFDEDSADIINQFNQCLEERVEDEQDESFREEIFTKVMGIDAHGRVRMYGAGVTPSQVFGQKSNSDNNENRMRKEL